MRIVLENRDSHITILEMSTPFRVHIFHKCVAHFHPSMTMALSNCGYKSVIDGALNYDHIKVTQISFTASS